MAGESFSKHLPHHARRATYCLSPNMCEAISHWRWNPKWEVVQLLPKLYLTIVTICDYMWLYVTICDYMWLYMWLWYKLITPQVSLNILLNNILPDLYLPRPALHRALLRTFLDEARSIIHALDAEAGLLRRGWGGWGVLFRSPIVMWFY